MAERMAWEAPRAAAKSPSSLLGQAVASQALQPTKYWETLLPRPLRSSPLTPWTLAQRTTASFAQLLPAARGLRLEGRI